MLSIATLCLTGTGYSKGVAEKLLGSAEKAISTIKNNPKYVQKIDELVDSASVTCKEMLDTVNSMISEEERVLLKQELKASAKVVESVIKEEAQTIDKNVRQILGNDKMTHIEGELNATATSFAEKIDTPENKELFTQLKNDLKPAVDIAEQAVQDLQEKFPQ